MKRRFRDDAKSSMGSAGRVVPRNFYLESPQRVARRILGKVLVSRSGVLPLAGRIVEAEAYLGAEDPAAHAYRGLTARNAVLFGPPGHAYVYFVYGMYSCLNVSCEPEGRAGGVLLRAVEPLNSYAGEPTGIEEMRRRRGLAANAPASLIASGPGKLCQAFGIERSTHNGLDLTDESSTLRIVDDGFRAGEIVTSPRIGIRKAADLPLRFHLAGNTHVSGKR